VFQTVCHRTGTVKVGNHILAINGESLSGKTLPQIEDMLNNCGNSVTLKIKKNVKSSEIVLTDSFHMFFLTFQRHGQNNQARLEK